MSITKRLFVDLVQYHGSGRVLINVIPQVVEDGVVIGAQPFENVHTTQDQLQAIAKAAGRATWDDSDIETAIRAEQVIDTPAVPGTPAELDDEGEVIREEVPAVDATYKPRFEPGTAIAWT